MENFLVNTNEYNGRYVALKSLDDHSVVGVGDDPESALQEARAKGIEDPVLVYIPATDTAQIY